jgi:hypothetical protein
METLNTTPQAKQCPEWVEKLDGGYRKRLQQVLNYGSKNVVKGAVHVAKYVRNTVRGI